MLEQFWKIVLRRGKYSPLAVPAFFLWIASYLYRFGARLKSFLSGSPIKVSVPVISIGNLTVGGSGKTPIVSLLAKQFVKRGVRVGIVSSGYGRTLGRHLLASGSELQSRRAVETGDEVLLLAYAVPEAVFSVDRTKAIAAQRLAESGRVDLIIVDDGFQHRKLQRDYDIVAFDVSVEDRLLKPFPYGVLREPLTALKRADAIILTRTELDHNPAGVEEMLRRCAPNGEILDSRFRISELVAANGRFETKLLQVRSAFLFAGIASFESLIRQVKPLVRKLDFALELADHQRYNRALLHRIKAMADRLDSECILTTGKDWVKTGHFDFGRESYYLELEVELRPSTEQFIDRLAEKLKVAKNT